LRLTIDEYCKHFKMSKEMLSSKLKAKKLNYIIENSSTYIIVTDKSMHQDTSDTQIIPALKAKPTKLPIKPRTTVATVLALYQRENQQLKDKIVKLEEKIDKLIDDKEQMLRDEMQKIEHVYSAKDEQLKTILELVNTKLMMEHSPEVHEIETIERSSSDEIEKEDSSSKLIELRSYVRTLDLKSYQRKVIKKRFLAVYDSDIRIIQQNGKLYLDFSKYDYSDLLEY
jgi:hypothetical protein